MATSEFDVREFFRNPSDDIFKRCCEDDLKVIAAYLGIEIGARDLKKEIKSVVWDRLVEQGVFVGSAADDLPGSEVKGDDAARVKVRLVRMQI